MIKTIADVCRKVYSGGTPSRKHQEYFEQGTIPWLNTGEIAFNRIYKTENFITEAGLSNSSAKWVPANAVIVAMYGATAARTAIAKIPLTTNQACCNLIVDEEIADYRYVYYYICSQYTKLASLANGGAQQNLNAGQIKEYPIVLPDLLTQKRIADILSAIDDKIENNARINDNLQQQAAALFESWFVNHDPWDGVQPSEWINAPLGSFVEIKRGGSPRPIQDYLSDSGLRWLKISDVTSLSSPYVLEIKEHIKEEGLRKTVFLHAGELVLSNSATPGIPKILDADTCIHDGWLYFPKSELSKYYLYLFFKHIRKELVALGNGSVFTNLKTDILKAYPATKADDTTLKEFDALVTPLFDAMLNADRENFKLAAMRDALLPKLMSSEIDVSEVEL